MCERTRVPEAAGCGGPVARAVWFALAAVQAVRPDMLARRTPCASWDLGMLLAHLADSLGALHEGMTGGRVEVHAGAPPDDPVSAVRVRAVRLLRAPGGTGPVAVGDRRLPGGLLAAAGALEIAVHGWDVAQATGERRPIPAALAGDLLELWPLLLPDPRRPLFAEPVDPEPGAGPGERLVALLGRRPLR